MMDTDDDPVRQALLVKRLIEAFQESNYNAVEYASKLVMMASGIFINPLTEEKDVEEIKALFTVFCSKCLERTCEVRGELEAAAKTSADTDNRLP